MQYSISMNSVCPTYVNKAVCTPLASSIDKQSCISPTIKVLKHWSLLLPHLHISDMMISYFISSYITSDKIRYFPSHLQNRFMVLDRSFSPTYLYSKGTCKDISRFRASVNFNQANRLTISSIVQISAIALIENHIPGTPVDGLNANTC